MIVSFLGSPCSGKTTTAARLFAELKEAGIPAEFITEYARYHIAKLRTESPTEEITLQDIDQVKIMSRQFDTERMFSTACGKDMVIVVDGCALNALLYMKSQTLNEGLIKNITEKALKLYDTVFVCEPIQTFDGIDPNRVHTFEQSMEIHQTMENMIQSGILKNIPGFLLKGETSFRLQNALSEVYRKLLKT